MLDVVDLAAEEARGQPLELVHRISDVETESAMLGNRVLRSDRGPSTPFGRRKRRSHFAQDDRSITIILLGCPTLVDRRWRQGATLLDDLLYHPRG